MPTRISRPRTARTWTAVVMPPAEPDTSKATSAPAPSVQASILDATSSAAASSARKPACSAIPRLNGSKSSMTTSAPTLWATSPIRTPTGPLPMTTTFSPGWTLARPTSWTATAVGSTKAPCLRSRVGGRRITVAPPVQWHDRDRIPEGPALQPVTNRGDATGHLVADDAGWVYTPVHHAVIDVQIRTADSGVRHLDLNLARLGRLDLAFSVNNRTGAGIESCWSGHERPFSVTNLRVCGMSKTRLIRLDQAMCCSRLKPVGVGWVQAQRMRRKGDLLVAADSSGGPVDIGPDPLTGKRREQRKDGFRTAKEAQSALAQVVAAVSTGEHRHDGRLTVGEWLTTWLDWRIENGLRASTALRDRAYVDSGLIPHRSE